MTNGFDQAAKAISDLAAGTLAGMAKKEHGVAAEASHLAALACERLQALATEQQIAGSKIDAIQAMLREAQNAGHIAFLRQRGTEVDYQAIGKKVTARFRTLGGKWRE